MHQTEPCLRHKVRLRIAPATECRSPDLAATYVEHVMAGVDGGAVAVADHDRRHLPGVDCDHRLVEKANATGDVATEDEHATQRQPGEGRQV